MELFPATDLEQFEYIKRIIDRSDYYVVIVAGKYGSLADDAVSFTEKEYEYAVSKKMPVLAFLRKNPEKIEVGKTDQDRGKSRKLAAFREKLKKSRVVTFWDNRNDLCTKVLTAVVNSVNLAPGVGWVRGDQAIDPKVLQDFERLRRENEELKLKLSELSTTKITFPDDLPSPDESVDLEFRRKASNPPTGSIQTSWREVFLAASEAILEGQHEHHVMLSVVRQLLRASLKSSGDVGVPLDDVDIQHQTVRKFRMQFEALGLIQAISKGSGPAPLRMLWSITDKGRQYLVQQMAVKREKEVE